MSNEEDAVIHKVEKEDVDVIGKPRITGGKEMKDGQLNIMREKSKKRTEESNIMRRKFKKLKKEENVLLVPTRRNHPPTDENVPEIEVLHCSIESLRNSRLQDFEYVESLGSGTFGSVQLVLHRIHHVQFARKTIMKSKLIDETKETKGQKGKCYPEHINKILSKLNHRHIVKLHLALSDSKFIHLFMEYVPGGNLRDYFGYAKQFSHQTTKHYAAQIVLALEYLHHHAHEKEQFIYRDLKPENIVLSKDKHLLKLVDFGLSKRIKKYTKTSSYRGTRHYIAPEIFQRKEYSPVVDWWSFGVIIFELLTGYRPFDIGRTKSKGNSKRDKLMLKKLICEEEVRFVGTVLEFNEVSKSFLQRLLKKNPEERLGFGVDGVKEIKSDPFFNGIDWSRYEDGELPDVIPGKSEDSEETGESGETDETSESERGMDRTETDFADQELPPFPELPPEHDLPNPSEQDDQDNIPNPSETPRKKNSSPCSPLKVMKVVCMSVVAHVAALCLSCGVLFCVFLIVVFFSPCLCVLFLLMVVCFVWACTDN